MSVARLDDPKILAVAEKVIIEMDPACERAYPERVKTIVEVETRKGETFSQANELITGGREKPMSDEDLYEKFKSYVIPSLGKRKTVTLLEHIMNLEKIENMNQLLRPLGSTK
jgi:2-methylcitrate dehydratase PrpD